MADAAWVQLDTLHPTVGVVRPVIYQELALRSVRAFFPPTPDDYRIALGINSIVRFHDGTDRFVTQTVAQIIVLLKAKV